MHQELLDKIRQCLEGFVAASGYVIVDLRLLRSQGQLRLRLFLDRPYGGISLEECADLNNKLGGLLDRENLIEESYQLEVSSPGVDWPLLTEKDFSRVVKRRIKVFLKEPYKARLEIEGAATDVKDGSLFLEVETEKDSFKKGEVKQIIEIPLNKINKAKQVIK